MRIAGLLLVTLAGLSTLAWLVADDPINADAVAGIFMLGGIGGGLLAWDRHRDRRRVVADLALTRIENGKDLIVPEMASELNLPGSIVSQQIYALKRKGVLPPDAKVEHRRTPQEAS